MSRLTKKSAIYEIKYLHRRTKELELEISGLYQDLQDYEVVGKEIERRRDLRRYIDDRESYLEEIKDRKQLLFDFLLDEFPEDSKVKLLSIYLHGRKKTS